MGQLLSPTSWGLAEAIEAGKSVPIDWIEVLCRKSGLVLTVPRLPLACVIDGRPVHASLNYAEQVKICRILGCVSSTYEWYVDIWAASTLKLIPKPLVRTAADAAAMGTLPFLLRENDEFEKQLQAASAALEAAGSFPRGFCKQWIIHPKMADLGRRGACNVGFRSPNGVEIQKPGGRHNELHLDYSQWAWDLPKRFAKDLSGNSVDLLELQCKLMPGLASRLRTEYGN